jgi:hypothetical protein
MSWNDLPAILAGSALRGLAVPLTATGLDERRLGPWRGASD